jgi:flagellar motor switch protein FliG
MREVDIRDLAVALKTASEQLKSTLLHAISRRAAETVKEEMDFLGTLKLKEIEAAKCASSIGAALESDGELELQTSHNRETSDSVVFAT